jgi:hypothetical protein
MATSGFMFAAITHTELENKAKLYGIAQFLQLTSRQSPQPPVASSGPDE